MYVRIISKTVCFTILDSAMCQSDTSPLEERNCCYFAVILNYRSPQKHSKDENNRRGGKSPYRHVSQNKPQ